MFKRPLIALLSVLAVAGTMLVGGQAATAAAPVTVPAAMDYGDPAIYGVYALSGRPDPVKDFLVQHTEADSSYRVGLQLKSGTAWKTVTTKAPATNGQTTLTYKLAKEGTVQLRAVITEGKRTVDASGVEKATWKREASAVSPQHGGRPFASAEGRVAAGDQVKFRVHVATWGTARTGALQMSKNGKWVNVQKLTWKKNSKGFSLATAKSPKTNSTVTRKYRVVVHPSAYEKGWTSKTGTLRHENPRHYTGYLKKSYNYMKRYCPNQIITKGKPGPSTAHYPSMRIEMAPGYRSDVHKAVALHECAHIITYRLYGDDLEVVEKRLNKIYKSRIGMEMVADCMSLRMGADRNAPVSWYTTNCKGARGDAARKILAGKKL